jgi:periplasmic protein TonB
MMKKILLAIIVLMTIQGFGFSQTKIKKIKDSNLKETGEEISVLKANQGIREGTYKRYIAGKLSVEGTYKNNEKTGTWKIYNYQDKVETEIDFNTGVIYYLSKDTITNSEIRLETKITPTDERPIINMTSSNMILFYLAELVKYPIYAQENSISGQVEILIKVNTEGKIIDYSVYKSVDKSLDDEALRVARMIPLELLPAYKNGVPVDSEIKVPVKFRLL